MAKRNSKQTEEKLQFEWRTKHLGNLLILANELKNIRADLATPFDIHRPPLLKTQKTPWELVSNELEMMTPEGQRFFKPMWRAVANFRSISRRASEARFLAETSPLIDDEKLRKKTILALEMTMEAMYHYWYRAADILHNNSLEMDQHRLRGIKAMRHASLEVSRACGSHLLEAGALLLSLSHEIERKFNAKDKPPPPDVKPDVLAAVRNAMKTNKKRESIIKASRKRRSDALLAMRYLEEIGEYHELNGNVPGTVPTA